MAQRLPRRRLLLRVSRLLELSLDQPGNIVLRSGTYNLVLDLTILEQQQGRDTPDVVLARSAHIVVDIELDYLGSTGKILGNLIDGRSKHPARCTPLSPEINQHRLAPIQYFLFETLIGYILNFIAHSSLLIFNRFRPQSAVRTEGKQDRHATIRNGLTQKIPWAKRPLGQHFLADPNTCRKIVNFAGIDESDTVVEIGPGTGALTQLLLASAREVIAIEFDQEMIAYLESNLPPELSSGLTLIRGDVLDLNWLGILPPSPVKIVGNLPYNISTPTLSKMTEVKDRFQSLTCMLQKEVAGRVLARPATKDYGYLTLLMEYHFERVKGFTVPPTVFIPRPRVQSSVIKLIPRRVADPVPDYERFLSLLRTAFSHRRKTLWNNLLRAGGHSHQELRVAFDSARLPHQVRAEELSLEQHLCLARLL